MNEKIIEENLKKLGYWQKMYRKPNTFGTGPTKLAYIAHKRMKNAGCKTILELGCGQGRDCLFFAEQQYQITATDFSPSAIQFIKNLSIEKKLSNLTTFELDMLKEFPVQEKFDCVYSNLALQFFDKNDLKSIFNRISKCLGENGLFIFSTKKPGDKYHEVGEKMGENAFKSKEVTRYFFEKNDLVQLVSDIFDIEVIDEKSHVNPDKTVSAWWYLITKKLF
jgi:cyclopropane fatty-acyl-phospholipid synthase-like methyltransferase